MSVIFSKFKESIVSILPITAIILLLHFTLTPLSTPILIKFLIGTLLMIIGMPLFLYGIDISITPIGELISEVLVKSNKLWIILIGGGICGLIVTIAEPDLHILANQVSSITSGTFNTTLMVILVSAGVGALILIGILRIVKNYRLNRVMTLVYLIILALGIFSNADFLGIAFDASGNTTGAVSVPFILAIAAGISGRTRSNEKEEDDGFGMLGIASSGAILAVLLQGIFTKSKELSSVLPVGETHASNILTEFLVTLKDHLSESIIVLLPILIIYLLFEIFWIKQSFSKIRRIFFGSVYTYFGLVLFLCGINFGFLEASRIVGYQVAQFNLPALVVIIGMIFGLITIPAEPSVHILTRQIEDHTAGSIRAKLVMFTLCIGVAFAVGLSMLRILIPTLALWHILLPGMIIAIVLSFIVPDIFVGIAYDSGGVAAGTMTSVFILPFAQGVADFIPGSSIVKDSFGIIAIVAMTPLIAVQILGLIYKIKTKQIMSENVQDDE